MLLVFLGLLTHLAAAAPSVEMYEGTTFFELPTRLKGVQTRFLFRVEKDASTRTGRGQIHPLIAVNALGLKKIDVTYRPGQAPNVVLEQFYVGEHLIIEGSITIERGTFVNCLRCIIVRKYVCVDKKSPTCDAVEKVLLEKGSKLTSVVHLKSAKGKDLQKFTVSFRPLTEAEFNEAKQRPARAIFFISAPKKKPTNL